MGGPASAQSYALKLLDVAFVAFRLAAALAEGSEKGASQLSKVCAFLRAKVSLAGARETKHNLIIIILTLPPLFSFQDAAEAVDECRRRMFEGVGV